MTTEHEGGADILAGDAIALTRALVRIDSRNPSLVKNAPGETEASEFLAGVLRAWGMRVELQEAAPGRSNVVARIGDAKAGAPTLMFNGHIDVVDVDAMRHPPFEADERDGRIYGRGSSDMKSGVAAMCAAAVRAAKNGLDGEIVVAAVVDEEFESVGTRTLVERGVRADAAIVTEPTKLAINPAHKGFTWIEVTVRGHAAHGSRYEIGVDAIRHAGLVLADLHAYELTELEDRIHPLLGRASLHASTISGGAGWSTYPDTCTFTIERRTLPGEQPENAVREVRDACARVGRLVPGFSAEVRHVFSQSPSDVAIDAPIVQALGDALRDQKERVTYDGMSAWTDAALLNAAGIPAILFGPGDIALAHSAEEWVLVDEIERATRVLTQLAQSWCTRGAAWQR
ncbi:MAG: ArgE/DapE family deacylase [Gemmatimonadaceae bacterium]